MPQTFFEQQERARKRTLYLLFLFFLAVFGIVVGIYLVIAVVFASREDGVPWDPELFLWIACGTVAFIGLASLIRILDLRKGGAAVAGMLGGRLVSRNTQDLAEKRLLNVVDEMSIASGISVPDVYVLDDETGINAFAAGYNVENAVVAVTRGALEKLDRDELQGVVAHEFSHILNGDMRLNIRLIGILFGILAVAAVGRMLLSVAFRVPAGRRDKKGTHPAIILLGLALLIIGYIGVFIGRLIQAAISRQREFLADASAVQFTRNPYGIGRALLKIAGMAEGSYMESPRTEEVSHLLFGEGRRVSFLSSIFSSHPPIEARIRRISPELLQGVGRPKPARGVEAYAGASVTGAPAGLAGATPGAVPAPIGGTAIRAGTAFMIPVATRPAGFMERVGAPGADSVGLAMEIIAAMPDRILMAVKEPEGAANMMFATVLDASEPVRKEQLRIITSDAGPDAASSAAELYELIAPKRNLYALPLAEVSAPALRTWPRDRQESFLRTFRSLIMADQKVTLFEFGLWWLLSRRLTRSYGPERPLYRSIAAVRRDASHLLAAIARAGHPDDMEAASKAFMAGLNILVDRKEEVIAEFKNGMLGTLDALGEALDHIAASSLAVRKWIVEATVHCSMADREVTAEEAELLRLFSIGLGCPVPPLVGVGRTH